MEARAAGIEWARKVRPEKIARLYEADAAGLRDEELADEVGFALLARCESILEVTEASRGRAKCHGCGALIQHGWRHDEVLVCERCGWTVVWETYLRSYQGKQLHGGAAVKAFAEFVERFPAARTYPEKMLLIDQLLHEFHWNLIRKQERLEATRPVAANLIDCRGLAEVAAFLGKLTSK